MARTVYACRFEVKDGNHFSTVVDAYRDWFSYHYLNKLCFDGFLFNPLTDASANLLPVNHNLTSLHYGFGENRVVKILWSYPDDNDRSLKWLNEIRIGQIDDSCSVEHLISIEAIEYNVVPTRLLLGSPRVIREIFSKTVASVGDMKLRAECYNLNQSGLSDFLGLLTSEMRTLPLVVLSPYANNKPNDIDSVQLSRNLAGIAVVIKIEEADVSWDFADEVGRQLSCFDGGARIYWPKFSKHSEPRLHRLFLGAWISQVGGANASRMIEKSIFAVASFRFVHDSKITNVIREFELAERQNYLNKIKNSGDDFWSDYERDLEKLKVAENKILELSSENDNLRSNQEALLAAAFIGNEVEELPVDQTVSFKSVVEAVESAIQKISNVDVLASAKESAVLSPFQRPYDVFKALLDLDEVVDIWRKSKKENGNGGDIGQHLRGRGWGKRTSMHISDTTRGRYKKHYEFEYAGSKQMFEPHITIGSGDANSCASIHFIFDSQREKMVVGHVGKHLPNTKT